MESEQKRRKGRRWTDWGWGLAGRQRELQGDVGMVLQHSPRQEAMKGVGTGRSEGDREPLSILQTHVHIHAHTLSCNLTWALHKSLSLKVSVAIHGNFKCKTFAAVFSSSATKLLSDTSNCHHDNFTLYSPLGCSLLKSYWNVCHYNSSTIQCDKI